MRAQAGGKVLARRAVPHASETRGEGGQTEHDIFSKTEGRLSALASLGDAAGDFARAISRALGVDVEIVDDELTRVAGTGRFESRVGESLGEESRAYARVLRSGRPLVVRRPGHEEVCRDCPKWQRCDETFEMGAPVLQNGRAIGVIGFVCFTDEQRRTITSRFAAFADFLYQMGGLIASKVAEFQDLERSRALGELLGNVMDRLEEGVLMLGPDGRVARSNRAARAILGLPESFGRRGAAPRVEFAPGGESLLGGQEMEARVTHAGGETQRFLVGREYALARGDGPGRERTFIFRDAQTLEREAMLLAMPDHTSEPSLAVGLAAMLGESRVMRSLKAEVARIARSRSTTLILGESGTGKELVARALAAGAVAGPGAGRRSAPFVAVNCGAIPERLIESELFGYARGAFTGAHPRGRVGRFEQAGDGTLFLDEIAELPLHLQAKLLRAIEQREITRLGASSPIPVRARIVAATNRDLERMVADGGFREDLYYRLNVLVIHAPPLREREGDVRLLGAAFVERSARRLEKSVARVEDDFWETLEGYSWPGNVRELQNAVEVAVNMLEAPGSLRSGHLPVRVRLGAPPAPASPENAVTIEAMEREVIRRALALHGGRGRAEKQMVADRLGLGLATLYRKLKKYGLG